MKLIAIPQWRDKHFAENSAPDECSVRRLLREGKLPGRKVGKLWFVDEAEWLSDGDELVRRVLEKAG